MIKMDRDEINCSLSKAPSTIERQLLANVLYIPLTFLNR